MNIIKRFWKHVDKQGPDECWRWTGYLKTEGYSYGVFKLKGKRHRAHRVSWAIAHRTWPIPEGGHICHTCDNKACVNPNHLYLGNNTTNMRDKSTLTPVDIKEIRFLHKFEGYTYIDLSEKFHVAKSTIGLICRKEHWKNV